MDNAQPEATLAPERVEQPKVEVPVPQHEPSPIAQEAPAVEIPQAVEPIAEVTVEVAPAPQTATPVVEQPESAAPQPQAARTSETAALLPDTPNILPLSDQIEAQGTTTPAAVETPAPAEQTAVFEPMQLPAETVAEEVVFSAQEPAHDAAERATVASLEQPAIQSHEAPSPTSREETHAEKVVAEPMADLFEGLSTEAPTAESEVAETETPAPRTEQQKKRARRQNKAQNAAGYTNITLPPAEQSHRAEKAERKQREEAHRRAVERAHSELADAPDTTDEAPDNEAAEAQPATTAAVAVARAAANREATTKVPVQHSKKAATTDAAPNFTNS